MKRLAFIIAAAALLVSAPRLALAFLMADGVQLAPAVEIAVYAGTGIAAGVVLTGGNIYLAHALAEHWKRRGALWATLLVCWVLFLGFAVVLIAPALVAGLQHSDLAQVLDTPAKQWTWAVVAALSVEVLAAAAMAASVLSEEPTQPSARRAGIGSALSGAAQRVLARIGETASVSVAEQPDESLRAAQPASLPSAQPAHADPSSNGATAPVSATQIRQIDGFGDAADGSAVTSSDEGRYPCRSFGCQRVFRTPQARSAHEGRAHAPVEASA